MVRFVARETSQKMVKTLRSLENLLTEYGLYGLGIILSVVWEAS